LLDMRSERQARKLFSAKGFPHAQGRCASGQPTGFHRIFHALAVALIELLGWNRASLVRLAHFAEQRHMQVRYIAEPIGCFD
jgi:hypothetical protein